MDKSKEEIKKEVEQKVEKVVEEKVTKWIKILIQAIITIIITVIVLKYVWGWAVPDLFPGAVSAGLVAAELTWVAAFKFAVLVGITGGVHKTLSEIFNS